MPKLSIITINYNNLIGLKRTVESVINQTWQDFEYIVIDGGSADGSKVYIESQNAHIDYWVSEPDQGIYNAMNKGIAKATGEYVVFLNSGDFYLSSKTLQLCLPILNTIQADVFYGQIKIDQDAVEKTITYPNKLTLSYLQNMVINHQACFFLLNTLVQFKGYDETYKLAADYHYYLKIYINNKTFYSISFPLIKYDLTGVSSLRMDNYRVEMKKVWNETIPPILLVTENKYLSLLSIINSNMLLKNVFKLREYVKRLLHGK